MRTILCTISTPNFLHFAINLARSVRENWSDPPEIWIALVGGRDVPLPRFELPVEVKLVPAEELGIPNLGWLAAKYGATDLCCAVKPFLVRKALEAGAERVVYSDADVHFFAAPHSLLELSARHSWTVTPHVLAPLPPEEAWGRPSLGDLFYAGTMNAGLFAVRDGREARRFLKIWSGMVTGPGAFFDALGPQHEQHAFNWIFGFAEDVAVCRDPALNVAYWNLHERHLRWSALDGGPLNAWTLRGGPLTCFHFSGFDITCGRVSRWDHRHYLAQDINIDGLCTFYSAQLEAAGRREFESVPYAYGRVTRGGLDRNVRDLLKRAEQRLVPTPVIEEWPGDVEAVFDRLTGVVGTEYFVPMALDHVLALRPDLRALPEYDRFATRSLLRWATEWLHREAESGFLFELCPFAFAREDLRDCAERVAKVLQDLDVDAASEWLRRDRLRVLQWLEERGADPQLVLKVRCATFRLAAFDPAYCIRLIHLDRPDLVAAFPDPMGDDLPGFRAWLAGNLAVEYEVPETVATWAANFEPERSLARILNFVRLDAARTARFLDLGLARTFLLELLPMLADDPGFSASDLVVADWWASSPDRMSAPGAERGLPFRAQRTTALERWHRGTVAPGDLHPESADPDGLNVFGYFRSPIGLGSATRGLCSTLALAGYRLREVVLSNSTMDSRLDLADLTPDCSLWYGRNVVVSYPHTSGPVFDTFPTALFRNRPTIGYLAWEQRDVHRGWVESLGRYDHLVAISSFSAEALGRAAGRTVSVLPSVVEVDEAAARAYGRTHHGIPEAAFVAGILFDASSSFERKNPLASARALVRAFGGQRDVRVVLKVTNGGRAPFDREVAKLLQLFADGGLEVLPFLDAMPTDEVHGLISTLDLCISLHRSEGFGYTLAEAMWLGVPVVATRYSGNLDFMNERNSWLVDCREVLVQRPEGPFRRGTVWAEADVENAAGHCRAIFEDRAEAARRAERAKQEVTATLSAAALADRARQIFG